MSGQGHPLPASDEARHGEIPEHLERDKGRGDDAEAATQAVDEAVNPDGEPYPPGSGEGAGESSKHDAPRASPPR